jgi:hypothetical protein
MIYYKLIGRRTSKKLASQYFVVAPIVRMSETQISREEAPLALAFYLLCEVIRLG